MSQSVPAGMLCSGAGFQRRSISSSTTKPRSSSCRAALRSSAVSAGSCRPARAKSGSAHRCQRRCPHSPTPTPVPTLSLIALTCTILAHARTQVHTHAHIRTPLARASAHTRAQGHACPLGTHAHVLASCVSAAARSPRCRARQLRPVPRRAAVLSAWQSSLRACAGVGSASSRADIWRRPRPRC